MNETRFRVRYSETDQMGIVYHANYLIWMEIGRVELVRSLGLNYHDLEAKEGLLLSVIQASCRYAHPARYDQEVCVATSLMRASARALEFGYRIYAIEPQRLLAEGSTRHLWLSRDLRPARLPGQYLEVLMEGLSLLQGSKSSRVAGKRVGLSPIEFGAEIAAERGLSPGLSETPQH